MVVGDHFDRLLANSYNLTILIRVSGLSYAVLDPVSNTYVAYGDLSLDHPDIHYAAQEEYLLREDIFKFCFRKVNVTIDAPMRTVVPKDLRVPDEERNARLLSFAGYTIEKDSIVLYDDVDLASCSVVYSIPKFLYFFIKTQFQNAKITHLYTSELSALLLKRVEADLESKMTVSMSSNIMSVIVITNGVLKLVSSYGYRNVNDVVYNVVNVLKQLQLEEKNTLISFGGDIAGRRDELFDVMCKFASNISLDTWPSYFVYDFGKSCEDYNFAALFRVATCE